MSSQGKSDAIAVQSEVLKQFQERYQLSEAEVQALTNDELDSSFFSALSRVREIHDRCKVRQTLCVFALRDR